MRQAPKFAALPIRRERMPTNTASTGLAMGSERPHDTMGNPVASMVRVGMSVGHIQDTGVPPPALRGRESGARTKSRMPSTVRQSAIICRTTIIIQMPDIIPRAGRKSIIFEFWTIPKISCGILRG